nr:hypothetical protein [Lachnospiraceae bacterium]
QEADILKKLNPLLLAYKEKSRGSTAEDAVLFITQMKENMEKQRKRLDAGGALPDAENRVYKSCIARLDDTIIHMKRSDGDEAAVMLPLDKYRNSLSELKKESGAVSAKLEALFAFAEKAFEDGNEMLTLLTRLTVGGASSRYIAAFGSETYNRLSESLMVSKRHEKIKAEILKLGLDEVTVTELF